MWPAWPPLAKPWQSRLPGVGGLRVPSKRAHRLTLAQSRVPSSMGACKAVSSSPGAMQIVNVLPGVTSEVTGPKASKKKIGVGGREKRLASLD